MKFASFVLEEVKTLGREKALELKTPFDEKELIEQNRNFLFENMPGLKAINVHYVTEEVEIEGS